MPVNPGGSPSASTGIVEYFQDTGNIVIPPAPAVSPVFFPPSSIADLTITDQLQVGTAGNHTPAIYEPTQRSDGGVSNLLQATSIHPTGNVFIDNALTIFNTTDNGSGFIGYASVTLGRSDGTAAGGTFFTMGTIGKPNGTGDYNTGGFIATNPLLQSALGTPMPFGLFQEKQDSSVYSQHRRIYFDTALGITAYGITDNSNIGPIGWFVDPTGVVVFGSNTKDSTGAKIQVPLTSGIAASFISSDVSGANYQILLQNTTNAGISGIKIEKPNGSLGVSFGYNVSSAGLPPNSAYFGYTDAITWLNETNSNSTLFCSSATDDVSLGAGNLILLAAGKTLSVKTGTNALAGTVTLAAGAGTITSTALTAAMVIVLTRKTISGAGIYPQIDVGAGSATVTGSATDNGTYNWVALKTA